MRLIGLIMMLFTVPICLVFMVAYRVVMGRKAAARLFCGIELNDEDPE